MTSPSLRAVILHVSAHVAVKGQLAAVSPLLPPWESQHQPGSPSKPDTPSKGRDLCEPASIYHLMLSAPYRTGPTPKRKEATTGDKIKSQSCHSSLPNRDLHILTAEVHKDRIAAVWHAVYSWGRGGLTARAQKPTVWRLWLLRQGSPQSQHASSNKSTITCSK